MSNQWTINGRFTFNGHAVVEAETAEEAKAKFESGEFDFQANAAELIDWESHGKPKEDT
jgi:hypothetical protein